MRFKERFVKITEYSLNSPKSSFGTTSNLSLSPEEEKGRTRWPNLWALRRFLVATNRNMAKRSLSVH